MGKKQHQSDKLYLTSTEWSKFFGGKKEEQPGSKKRFRRLPYDCCSVSMQPFENPYCTEDGSVFDLMNILPFLKKYGLNPVSGKKMTAKELTKLTFHKNSKGEYHCPVTFKVFNENTHIVAIKTTGNVYALEALETLCFKVKNMKDLIDDTPFTRADVITIQNPTELAKFNLSDFYHLKKNLKVADEDEELAKKDPKYRLKAINAETRDILNELDKTYVPEERKVEDRKRADHLSAAHYSTNAVAASFTSTAVDTTTSQEAGVIDEDILKYERVKKKGYVRLLTNFGPLNLELHCEMVPKTCDNFMQLCNSGYYNNTKFHRSIRNFMIQGGDPTGTGKGGDSVWGGAFRDDFKPNLHHAGRGILSMANSGPNTNKSQFFITYRSARHLDNKHTVFGRVVGGLETLDKMEKVEIRKVDGQDDIPVSDIIIQSAAVFVNPFEEATKQLEEERAKRMEEERQKEEDRKKKLKPKKDEPLKVYKSSGIGRYINPSTSKEMSKGDDQPQAKKKKTTLSFNNFSNW